MIADVSQIAGQCGGGKYVSLGIKVESQASRFSVEPHEARTVRCAHVHHSITNSGRADYPGFAGWIVPLLPACCCVYSVYMGVAASHIYNAVHYRRRGLESDLVVD